MIARPRVENETLNILVQSARFLPFDPPAPRPVNLEGIATILTAHAISFTVFKGSEIRHRLSDIGATKGVVVFDFTSPFHSRDLGLASGFVHDREIEHDGNLYPLDKDAVLVCVLSSMVTAQFKNGVHWLYGSPKWECDSDGNPFMTDWPF